MKIETVLCRAGTMDNYSYIITDEDTGISAIVDAPEAEPVVVKCSELGVVPQFILNTHHHYDHTDANLELKRAFNAKIVGAVYDEHRIPGIDITVKDGDVFKVGNLEANIIKAEGHTTGHILWYFPKEKVLFTGDVLFNLCIGGLFEGTPMQMRETLNKIKALSDDVLFYPGHEYTLYALQDINTDDTNIKEYISIIEKRLKQGLPAGPIALGLEKKCNPYLKR